MAGRGDLADLRGLPYQPQKVVEMIVARVMQYGRNCLLRLARFRWQSGFVVIVTLALLSACSDPAKSAGYIPAIASDPAAILPSNLSAEALDSFIPASGPEYANGAQFEGLLYALQYGITNACMVRYGFNELTGHGISASAYAAQDVDNSQFPNLARIARTRSFDTGDGFQAPPRPPQAEQKTYNTDSQRCDEAANKPFLGLLRAGSGLEDQWFVILNAIQASAPVRAKLAGFAACVESEGTPRSSANSLGSFLAWETGVDTHAKTLARIHAVDRRWAPIFARCAEPTVGLQEQLQLAARTAFLQRESQQVQQFQALVGPAVSKAEGEAQTPS
jgi:hypothetical protein